MSELTINFLRLNKEDNFIIVLIVHSTELFLYHFWLIYNQHHLCPNLDMKLTVLLIINNYHYLPPYQNVTGSISFLFHDFCLTCNKLLIKISCQTNK